MSNDHPHFEEIDARLRDNIDALVTHFAGKPGKRRGNEIRWGNKGGLKADIAGPNKGRITPFDGDGKGMSPFQFIMQEQCCSFPNAVEWAAGWLGLSSDYKPDPDAERRRKKTRKLERREAEALEQADKAKRITKATAIWKASQDATGTPVEAYLAARGVTVTLPPDIRFLPPQKGSYGALIAAARDTVGTIRAVQRVFIHNGKKPPITPDKRTNGVMDGAAVRLPVRQGNEGKELVLAEGPETGLSVWQVWGRETLVALGSIAKLIHIIPVDRPVVIARDADIPGSQADIALMKAVSAMMRRGISVRVVSPPNPTKPGYDFNDALMDYGIEAVADALENGGRVKPRHPAPAGTVDEARVSIHNTFSAWSGALPAHWENQSAFNSYMTDLQRGKI
jgi:putative DNA primase/helicase